MKKYKDNSRNNFNKQAIVYDNSIYSMYPRKCYGAVIKEIKALQYRNLLDVGCGTGEILNKIATDKNNYYGLDLSEKMIEIAKSKKNSKNITYLVGDSEFLPFDNETFDVIICIESFHHYPNPNAVMKEFYRVLNNGGILLLCDMYRKAPLRQFYNVLMKIVNTGDVKIYTRNEMTEIISKANLKLENYYFSTSQTYTCVSKKEVVYEQK